MDRYNNFATQMLRSLCLAGVVATIVVLLSEATHAQQQRFSGRAGSRFTGQQTDRRPYQRKQFPTRDAGIASNSSAASTFDYRLDAEHDESAGFLADLNLDQEYVEQASFQPAGCCDCGNDLCCGDCVEAGCGCDDYCDPGCGCDDYCEPGCGCDESLCGSYGPCKKKLFHGLSIGFEWSFVKPRFSDNVAFTTFDTDGANNDVFSDTQFDYDLELTPRVWLEAAVSDGWSWRAGYWQFDHAPNTVTTSPNTNGLGEITHPTFGDVDISTVVPTDTFTAASSLNAYTIEVEALKRARVNRWNLGVGGGVRYASTEQTYLAELRNAAGTLLGEIDYTQELEGVGPTFFVFGRRPISRQIHLNCAARGSLLFGDGGSRLDATEDTLSTTVITTDREDLLPIGEARVGLDWRSVRGRSSWQWTMSTAMEGQIWGGAGNASSESGDLGFFGFNVGAGWIR